tara:strand:- start:36 stop:221 length:186 start_codon:yes stop_codon:yes gene_type:complete
MANKAIDYLRNNKLQILGVTLLVGTYILLRVYIDYDYEFIFTVVLCLALAGLDKLLKKKVK